MIEALLQNYPVICKNYRAKNFLRNIAKVDIHNASINQIVITIRITNKYCLNKFAKWIIF